MKSLSSWCVSEDTLSLWRRLGRGTKNICATPPGVADTVGVISTSGFQNRKFARQAAPSKAAIMCTSTALREVKHEHDRAYVSKGPTGHHSHRQACACHSGGLGGP